MKWPAGGYQHSLRFAAICRAKPPSEVSLYLVFISRDVSSIERMTASREILAQPGSLSSTR